MKIEEYKIKDLKPYERNAKKHDERQIKNVMQSIKQLGWAQPLVVDKNNELIIGHCRLIAAKRLGLKVVPVVKMEELTEEQAQMLRLLDNKLNESEWDMELLAQDVPDLDWEFFDIDWDLPELEEEPEEIVEDEVPEVPEEPRSKLGDLYILGEHRLLCGDSTDVNVIDRLMDGVKADMLLTDPPYNVALGMGGSVDEARKRHRRTDGLVIMNDKMEDEDFYNFLLSFYTVALAHMKEGASFYVWHADNEGLNFRKALKDAGATLRQTLIWNKNAITLGRQDYQWKHEPCLYGWKDGASHKWYSDRKQSTVLEFNKPAKSELHPTMKPIELLAYQIRCSSKEADSVLDCFGGSGSTLIACEQLNRKCYMCELDPHYIDVIIERWENLTGKKAELIREG